MPAVARASVAGAVLCGGSSRRMGADKALLVVDGVAMAERVARVLEAAGCNPVVFVGGDQGALEQLGRRFVPDRWPGEGPVGGVLTALQALGEAAAVVIAACDLPDLTADVVVDLIGPDDGGAEPRVADSGRLEPMLACWPTAARAQVEASFQRGERALHDVVGSFDALRIVVDPVAVRNVNHPGDL